MRKFLIFVSGLYFILIAFLCFASIALMLKAPVEAKLDSQVLWVGMATFVVHGLLLVATGMGVIMKKNWARISLTIISGFALFMGLASLVMYSFAPFFKTMQIENVAAYKAGLIATQAITAVFFVLIPSFLLVFFNRKSVKEMFIAPGQYQSPVPFGVKFIAVFLAIGAVGGILFNLVSQQPIPFFGMTLLGGHSTFYMAVMCALQLYVSIGFFKLDKKAWNVGVGMQFFYIIMIISQSTMLTQAQLNMITAHYPNANQMMSLAQYRIMSLFGLIFPIVVLVYLFMKKNLFEAKIPDTAALPQDG